MIFSKSKIAILVFFIISLIFVSYNYFDKEVALYFIAHKETFKPIGKFLSIFGESQWYIGTGVLGFLYFKYKKPNELYKNRFLFLFYINVFSGLISILLKLFFGRIRPKGLKYEDTEYGFLLFKNFDLGFVEKMKVHFTTLFHSPSTYSSFPSGHTVTIFATVMYLYLLFPKYTYLWLSLGLVFASGRILAADHFVSDVLAGMLVGSLSTLYIYQNMKNKVEKYS
ncbi:phosphatase PAP2 family protein [Sulfurimonas sp.]|uniref:phosphatase PAP2 family protein n=1 Tax=Sulfurimonas sp. TaxID=2022749 RepID=UPI002638C9BE|nr:phosphatase PAP2 family protein [Sulfurimonas sp.]